MSPDFIRPDIDSFSLLRICASTKGPGSFTSVLERETGSMILVLVLVSPSMDMCKVSMPCSESICRSLSPLYPPKTVAARLSVPRAERHLLTFMPFPPASTRRNSIRLTLPGEKHGITTVLSMAGFKVTVNITELTPFGFLYQPDNSKLQTKVLSLI